MVQESLFGKLAMQLANLMSTPDLHTNSNILAVVEALLGRGFGDKG